MIGLVLGDGRAQVRHDLAEPLRLPGEVRVAVLSDIGAPDDTARSALAPAGPML